MAVPAGDRGWATEAASVERASDGNVDKGRERMSSTRLNRIVAAGFVTASLLTAGCEDRSAVGLGKEGRAMIARLTTALETNGVSDDLFQEVLRVDDRPVRGVAVPGDAAVECWRAARRLVAKTKHWPLLVGNSDELARVAESLEFTDESAEQILEVARDIHADKWMQKRIEEYRRDYAGFGEKFELPRGSWPGESAGMEHFTIPTDILNGEPLAEVWLLFVPAERSWEVPAFLKYGNWNECPEAAVHVAMFRHWNEHYGAEVVGMSGDVVEMSVGRPPGDKASALRLAELQYIYCADIVDQGVGTIENLAAGLLNTKIWYFWWD
jgi:hypothetical protein